MKTTYIAIFIGFLASALAHDVSDTQPEPSSGLRRRAPKSKSKSKSGNHGSKVSAPGPFTGKLTWYKVEADACATHSKATDMVAALGLAQYGDPDSISPNCGRCAQVKGDKATVVVKIVDACKGCSFGQLDLSEAAFKAVTNADGEAYNISWSWVSC
ncbi:hypothetical protein FBU31_000186 [Coemansia sp. 'formosensis']|nr:hypothetical protein FBU31_000186 [Coemansia sp. 'formosensis']